LAALARFERDRAVWVGSIAEGLWNYSNAMNSLTVSTSSSFDGGAMDQSDDPRELELERKIEQAARIASSVNDPTTVQRLRAFVEDLRQRLRALLEARRIKQEIRTRARELWEQNGRPADRDLEFWLQAEAEIGDRERRE
jgi:hypothetical protein